MELSGPVGLASTARRPVALQVEVHDISKHFRGARALEDVSLSVAPGEIHALVGENGAGKSTLGKIIAGAVTPDRGELRVGGRAVQYRSPADAIRDGVAIIDQELALAPTLSVLDNVFMGAELGRRGLVDRRQQRLRFTALAERVGFECDPSLRVGALRTADQQKVEVLRALLRDARLIVMDEPTAALTREEAQRLLDLARSLRDEGVTIIYVTHFLADVLALSDTVTVLKDGKHVRTGPTQTETVDSLVTAMLGRTLEAQFPDVAPRRDEGRVVLSVQGLSRPPAFEDVTFEIRAGEIVGLGGLVGSGRTEIARAIFGADSRTGVVMIDGAPLHGSSPAAAIKRGLALLPESRKDQGLVMMRRVGENITMAHLDEFASRGIVNGRREERTVRDVLRQVRVEPADPAIGVASLSGGNQQKVVIGKWLVKTPRVLIADEPTRGVDVGAKRSIYELIQNLAADGMAVLVISSELDEILGLAHRVLVVRSGRIVAEFERDAADEEAVMRAAFGTENPRGA